MSSELKLCLPLTKSVNSICFLSGKGVDVGGEYEPYHQIDRQTIYNDYYQQLEAEGIAYPCFCSEEQLTLSRKLQRSRGIAPRYAGTCRGLSKEEVAQ